MITVTDQIRKTINESNLISEGDHVVIGLSGGPDSMCLFHALNSMAEEMNLTLHPVHLNHKFRPGEAERDQEYVESFCQKAGVPAKVFTVDCNALASELGMTSEEAGRKARYDAFYQVAEEIDAPESRVKIAVAQNANDQAETVLFRVLRGTGTDGLAGMAYRREEGRNGKSYMVVRPLLDVWRKDIEAYCAEHGLNPVTDHTNQEEIYTRNKIRLGLIPYIEKEYNSNIQESLVRLSGIAAQDKDYFWQETEKKLEELRITKEAADNGQEDGVVVLDRQGLADCHKAIRYRVIMKAFGETGLTRDITAERIEAADAIIGKKQGEKKVEFPHGYTLTVAKGRVIFAKQ